jgi:diaminohydroxyphosphoribosylaminopyrimidine deaminase / 5-amino-6-(5-phosphoribosylamino)uracil reductase
MSTDEQYMHRCLELALLGAGQVSPNPMVGAVIVHGDRIIGEGYHQQYGGPHAEVNAVRSVALEDQPLLTQSTMYVSLEPCAHFGKTPPCADLIISLKIPRVVVGCRDPFPAVNGKGIEKLQSNGVDVVCGVLEKECLLLNRRFFTFHQKHRPWVILKWAETTDGLIGIEGERLMITGEAANRLVHRWRTEEDAIMIGTGTALNDDPSLTARYWPGKNPLRVVLDLKGRLPKSLNLFSDGNPTLVLRHGQDGAEGIVRYRHVDPAMDLVSQVLKILHSEGALSVIIEGGAQVLNSFLAAGAWDEIRRFISPKVAGRKGQMAPGLPSFVVGNWSKVGDDELITAYCNPESGIRNSGSHT